ncbi:MAG: Serine/threonine protein kinase [Cyanobacteria bacterium RYN_339]|nr:Serine/threonine protein kinase [Cyanobacteria bacterium RYN_339]
MQVPALPSKLEHRQLLGAGGMGQVHLAFDRERGHDVAVKLLTACDGVDREEARFLFKQEFWVMASLRHPNLVAAYDYGELADGTPYFTMEVVGGQDLAPTQDEAGVRAWLPGVAAALGYLHSQGYVHGDLKPENIRLGEVSKLMDLGLLSRSGRAVEAIRGSLAYMAPEMIRQGALDGRTDLYSLGAVLYHVLAGKPPFPGDQPLAVLRAHLDQRPAPLRELRPDVSPALETAVMRLLAKEPGARYAGVAALLEALGMQGVEAGPAGLLGSAVIGRDEPQEALRRLVTDDRADARWLAGEAGAGKSRLLQEARAEAQLAGLPAPLVRGLGADAPPYQALRPLLEALVDPAHADAALAQRLAPVLVSVLPDLGVAPAPALEGAQERLRLQLAVAELALATYPAALWLVDDADLLDAASRDMIAFLRRQGVDRGWRWVQAASSLTDEPGAIVLAPLEDRDALDLARALLGQDQLPAAVADRLIPLSGGQPGAIEAVLGHWVRTGALKPGPAGWAAGPDDAFDLPGGLRVALDASFQALDEETRRVARTAAILGSQADLPWLAALAGGGEAVFFQALQALEAADVLAFEGLGGERRFRFTRPAQAAVLAATWDEPQRRELHGRAARLLARRLGDAPDVANLPLAGVLEVARHELAGDRPVEGLAWILAAIRRALAMFELDAAGALLGRTLALPDLPEAERLALEVMEANKLRFQGRTDDALAFYQDHGLLARLEASNGPAYLNELISFAVLKYLKSQYDDAGTLFDKAIALADAADEAGPAVRARMFRGRMAYFRGDLPTARERLAEGLVRAREAKLTTQLAATLGFYGYILASADPAREAEGLALLDEAIALNRELRDPTETNEALDLQGNLYLSKGRFQEARENFRAVLTTTDRLGMDLDAVTARLNLGAVMLELGELEPARIHAQQANAQATRQGRKFPQGYTLALEGAALVQMGQPMGGQDRIQRGLALAREIGNRYLELNVLALWVPALLQLGRFEEAGEALAQARQVARQTQNLEMAGKFDRFGTQLAALEAMAAGEPAPAVRAEVGDRLERQEAAARAGGQAVELATALLLAAQWKLHLGHPEAAGPLASEGFELAAGHGLRGLEAELTRTLARVALAGGDEATARERFEASHALAEELGNRPLALLDEHDLGGLDHDVRRQRDAARALRALNDLPPGLAEAYDRPSERAQALAAAAPAAAEGTSARVQDLLEWLEAIDEREAMEDVLQLAVRALVQLADAERGFLLLFDGIEVTHEVFYGMGAAESDAYSTSLAYEVLYAGEPVILEDVMSDARLAGQQSIQALALRSVVGVPLVVEGETLGTMLADSRRVNPHFAAGLHELVMPLARHVARAIARVRKQSWQQQALDQHGLLFDLALATAGKRTLEDFFAPVAAAALELTGAQQAYLLTGPDLAPQAAFDARGRAISADPRELSSSVARYVFDRGEPLHVADAQHAEDFQAQRSVLALGLRAIHAVPVEHAGRQLGVLYLQSRTLGPEDQAVLHTLMRMGELLGAYMASSGVGELGLLGRRE